MNDFDSKTIVRDTVIQIIDNSITEKNIQKALSIHKEKVHFIPAHYLVFSGLLQSLNIKFGYFIEKLISQIIESDPKIELLLNSGERVKQQITKETDSLIDKYITERQQAESPDRCDDLFQALQTKIFRVETQNNSKQISSKTQDVDSLFKTPTRQIIYLEIKYNDDHDTGKFIDINRKFLKTYAGLINYLNIKNIQELKPILYYFNSTKRWGPVYVPSSNIYRGRRLFEEYFSILFDEIHESLLNLGQDKEIIRKFDDLYEKIKSNEQVSFFLKTYLLNFLAIPIDIRLIS
ncbi:HinfI family type II restriction enzyme [Candidatus Nitrosacidococcus sp. I8]|uniref:HinfI family type II restriction enzyme n=1 Tax=Candidatus Nitrosacidococcus sp. I8 TaxID=2942908 RepID=UPI0022276BF7|nr:hypothetical protein [Candidatus Nitrosacidococcus sp. I8]CAH9016806.1 hypothetical protein NURINAE_00248 [Candidatus Nitrosacidococcus sp. I8]